MLGLGLEDADDASVCLFLLFLDCTRVKPSSSMMGLFLVEGTVCVVAEVETVEAVEGVVPVVECNVLEMV